MDQVIELWSGFGPFSWLALAAILFAAELATGTAYLLWLSAAAVMTALFVALPIESGIAMELVAFGIFAIASTMIGKRFFKPGQIQSDQPDLNDPSRQHIGARAVAAADFIGGEGRVALGDTQWSAQTLDGSSPVNGSGLTVVSVDGTMLRVTAAD
jgi:inner membrane protein